VDKLTSLKDYSRTTGISITHILTAWLHYQLHDEKTGCTDPWRHIITTIMPMIKPCLSQNLYEYYKGK